MEGRFEIEKWGTKGENYLITVGFRGKSSLDGKTYELAIPPQAPSHDGSIPSVAKIVEDDLNIQNRGIALIGNGKKFDRIEELASEARRIGMQTLTDEERTTGVLQKPRDQKELNKILLNTGKRQLKKDTSVLINLLKETYSYFSKFWKK